VVYVSKYEKVVYVILVTLVVVYIIRGIYKIIKKH